MQAIEGMIPNGDIGGRPDKGSDMNPQRRSRISDEFIQSVSVPKWMLTLGCTVLGLLLTCGIAWVASLESRMNSHAIASAEIRTRQMSQQDLLDDVKQDIGKLTDKVDQLPVVLREIAADIRKSTASQK